VASKKVGDEVSLVIERNEQSLAVEVEVRELSYEGETSWVLNFRSSN